MIAGCIFMIVATFALICVALFIKHQDKKERERKRTLAQQPIGYITKAKLDDSGYTVEVMLYKDVRKKMDLNDK